MKEIIVEKLLSVEQEKEFLNKRAVFEPSFKLLNESVVLKDKNGKVLLYYIENFLTPENCELFLSSLRQIHFPTDDRSNGLITTSKIFGYMPRVSMRRDYCRTSILNEELPLVHDLFCSFAKELDVKYEELAKEVYDQHKDQVSMVKNEWLLPNSVYTSGIINKNNALNYHFDRGNFNNCFSSMIVLKNQVEQGYLNLPAYGLSIECKDNSLVVFDGQSILHGVTPIKKLSLNAVRYSIVYYSLKQMWNCLTKREEIERVRKKKFERELKRFEVSAGLREQDKSLIKQVN